jgi:transcriptional regulator with XRE-family HTH domain
MKTRSTHFAAALRSALAELNLTQLEFAESAHISVALLTKIFRGETVHRKSLQKLFAVFWKDLEGADKARRTRATRLITAYLRDVSVELGLDLDESESIDMKLRLLSSRDRAILSLFSGIHDPEILLALYCLGKRAAIDEATRDAVFSLADLANSAQGSEFGAHYFRKLIKLPPNDPQTSEGRPAFRLFGGSFGETVSLLRSVR